MKPNLYEQLYAVCDIRDVITTFLKPRSPAGDLLLPFYPPPLACVADNRRRTQTLLQGTSPFLTLLLLLLNWSRCSSLRVISADNGISIIGIIAPAPTPKAPSLKAPGGHFGVRLPLQEMQSLN